MRVLITGGGTGGHTSPAVAILEELRRRDPRLIARWVGRRGGIEERVAKSAGVPFRGLPVEGWPRRKAWRKPVVAAKLAWSAARAWLMVRQFDPQVAIGVGGYVSLPVMWAAQQQGVPTVLHEQNRLMGLANRKLAPKASRVFLTFDDTKGPQPEDRTEVVGNPVRPGFVSPPEREAAREALGLDAKTPVVLVYGGSQGARRINEALAGALPGFREGEAAFIWGAGPGHIRRAREAAAKAPVQVAASPFIDDMPAAFAAADLVVARSGASTTSELAAMGKPAILVPYPHATDNHQEHNARAMEAAGAARVLLDGDCTAEALAAAIRELLSDRHGLAAMGDAARGLAKINAAERIVDGVFELVFEGRD